MKTRKQDRNLRRKASLFSSSTHYTSDSEIYVKKKTKNKVIRDKRFLERRNSSSTDLEKPAETNKSKNKGKQTPKDKKPDSQSQKQSRKEKKKEEIVVQYPEPPKKGVVNETKRTPTASEIKKQHKDALKKAKQQNCGRYSYKFGNRYPGLAVGHNECTDHRKLVPPHMGWQWDVENCKGWRPGAIRKPIQDLMQYFLASYPMDTIPVTKKGANSNQPDQTAVTNTETTEKSALQIQKKCGEYTITMNPLKDSHELKTAKDPFLSASPIKLKITKDSQESKSFQLRRMLKEKGFTMCRCKDPMKCSHRTDKEKRLLVAEMKKMVDQLKLPKNFTLKDIPENSGSEMNVEFTPPSLARKQGPRVKSPDKVIAETQYNPDDYKLKEVDLKKDGKDAKKTKPGLSGAKSGDKNAGKGDKDGANKGGKLGAGNKRYEPVKPGKPGAPKSKPNPKSK